VPSGIAFSLTPIKMIAMPSIIPIKMSNNDALTILRRCVTNDALIFISSHAIERMIERNITRKQIIACLEKGTITEAPHRDVRGDWRCRIEHYTAGDVITVAVAFKFNAAGERIVVITVF
jgi:hypothetical protein